MFQYFFINYTKKQIRYAGDYDILKEIAYYLNKACILNGWEMTDHVHVFDLIRQPTMRNECNLLIIGDRYHCEEEYLDAFIRT